MTSRNRFPITSMLSAIVAAAAVMAGPLGPAACRAQSPAFGPPDVQVLVLRTELGQEMVDLTYPKIVPEAQAERDVTAIVRDADLHAQSRVEISNAALPLQGVKSVPMTSATFETSGALPDGQTLFHLEPWIVALKGYRNLAITYVVGPKFAFNGLRSFANGYVRIALDQSGQSYTYRVQVLNSGFDSLHLPLVQPNPAVARIAQADPRSGVHRAVGIIAVAMLAAAAGCGVYVLLSRLS